jgi:hypothetical protein
VRLRIEYYDHNESFATQLPRLGTVSATYFDANGVGPWLLVDLDEPLQYQLKVGEPFQFRALQVDAFLIRSRWQGKEVGDSDGVSVFILLVEQGSHPSGSVIDPKAYFHVAWGTAVPQGAA